MRVAYLSSAPIPARTANSIHTVKMCAALSAIGHETVLFATRNGRGDVYAFYGVDPGFRTRFLWHPRIRYFGHVYGAMIALAARRWSADLCVGRHAAACLCAAMLKIPTVFEIHGPVEHAGRATQAIIRRLLKHDRLVLLVVVTRSLGEYYRREFPELADRIIVAPDAADPVDDRVGVRHIARAGLLNVGYAGHLYTGKGMEVISRLAPLCPFAHFHIVGGRDEDIHRWREQMSSYPNVTFHGFQQHTDVAGYIKAFDVAVLPNQRSVLGNAGRDIASWTSPLKLFEYMAAGRPIVASDIEVLKEILTHRRNALLCDPEDVEAWRRALLELHENVQLRETLGSNACREFHANWTWTRRVENILTAVHRG